MDKTKQNGHCPNCGRRGTVRGAKAKGTFEEMYHKNCAHCSTQVTEVTSFRGAVPGGFRMLMGVFHVNEPSMGENVI